MYHYYIKILSIFLCLLFLFSVATASDPKIIKSGTYETSVPKRSILEINQAITNTSVSSSDHFTLHYTLSGEDAVTTTFRDSALSILEQMWTFQVNETGFKAPPGSGDGKVHVYLKDMTTPYGLVYGQTVPLDQNGGTEVESYMEIDNDFLNVGYSSRGLNGLRITIAHEFFHAIQMGYRYSPQYHYFYEWGSTWMEEYAYPEINDYINYVYDFFENPETSIRSSSDNIEYAHSLFLKTLELNVGSIAIVLILENLEAIENDPLQITLDVAAGMNYPVEKYAVDYLTYSVFTGRRTVNGYGFEDAILLPEIEITNGNLSDLAWSFSLEEWGIGSGMLDGGIQGDPCLYVNGSGDFNYFVGVYDRNSISLLVNGEDGVLDGQRAVNGVINTGAADQQYYLYASPERSGVPDLITLGNGYPNPFNSAIRWNYRLDRPGKAEVIITNSLGREVFRTVVDSGPQRHSAFYWNGTNKNGMACASGIYILSLNAGKQIKYSKVIKIN